MKKNYIAPAITVQNIAFARIMVSSIVVDASKEGPSALSKDFYAPSPWETKEDAEQSALTDSKTIITADVPAQYIGGISVIVVRAQP